MMKWYYVLITITMHLFLITSLFCSVVGQNVECETSSIAVRAGSSNDVRMLEQDKKIDVHDNIFLASFIKTYIEEIESLEDVADICSFILRYCLYINERVNFSVLWNESASYEQVYPFFTIKDIDNMKKDRDIPFCTQDIETMNDGCEEIFSHIWKKFGICKYVTVNMLWAYVLLEDIRKNDNPTLSKPLTFYTDVVRKMGSFLAEFGFEIDNACLDKIENPRDFISYLTLLVDKCDGLFALPIFGAKDLSDS